MWAVIDFDGKTVVGVYPPDVPEDVRNKDAGGRTQILMTLENSPGYFPGIYRDGKFYPPEEING